MTFFKKNNQSSVQPALLSLFNCIKGLPKDSFSQQKKQLLLPILKHLQDASKELWPYNHLTAEEIINIANLVTSAAQCDFNDPIENLNKCSALNAYIEAIGNRSSKNASLAKKILAFTATLLVCSSICTVAAFILNAPLGVIAAMGAAGLSLFPLLLWGHLQNTSHKQNKISNDVQSLTTLLIDEANLHIEGKGVDGQQTNASYI